MPRQMPCSSDGAAEEHVWWTQREAIVRWAAIRMHGCASEAGAPKAEGTGDWTVIAEV